MTHFQTYIFKTRDDKRYWRNKGNRNFQNCTRETNDNFQRSM